MDTTTNRCPTKVRGGIALHAGKLWPFVQAMQRLELDCFGCELSLYGKELKGSTLVDRKRFGFANRVAAMQSDERRKLCRSLFTKGLEKKLASPDELSAYGQACLLMAEGIFQLLRDHNATIFASLIPRGVVRPKDYSTPEFLRKDQVFLLQRYFFFLEAKKEQGPLILDQVEKSEDRRFVRQLQGYFTKTTNGRHRSAWIVPSPFFVSSDMTAAIQAADLCIYCINWGFRLTAIGVDADRREEIADRFGYWIRSLQYRGQGYDEGVVFHQFSIFYVPDPYSSR